MNWAQANKLKPGDRLRVRESFDLELCGTLPEGTILEYQGCLDLLDDECNWIENAIEGHSYRHMHVRVVEFPPGHEQLAALMPQWWSRAGEHGGFYVLPDRGLEVVR